MFWLILCMWAAHGYRIDTCPAQLNQTKIKLHHEYQGVLPSDSKLKLRFVSKSNVPFELTLYTTDGQRLFYKGTDLSMSGAFTYVQIKNTSDNFNPILLEMWTIETDYVRYAIGLFSLVAIGVLIVFKRDHYVSQAVLIILLLVEIWNTSDYEKISEKVIKKYLF